MDDSADLQARIARLAGRINRHKTSEQPSSASGDAHVSKRRSDIPSIDTYELSHSAPEEHTRAWVPQRGTPYGVPRGRGWNPRPATHRNRTLIVNAPHQEQDIANTATFTGTRESTAATGWVTKQDRHMQLINNNVYEQKTKERTRAMEETRRQKEIEREEREKAKIMNHLQTVTGSHSQSHSNSQDSPTHQILVKNIRFIVAEGGSKLIKARDDANLSLATPKRTTVGGVTFFRSRNGNLYRAGLVKSTRRSGIRKVSEPCVQFSTTGSVILSKHDLDMLAPLTLQKTKETSVSANQNPTGTCAKGPQCRYVHDPEKVAICRDFLQTGKCQAGDDCDLSHDPKPERVPACLHFQRGNCTNNECRYAHVRTTPGAPVCRAFATLGYCSKGAECAERHVHECPDYANKGICRNTKCRLPHVDRAGQLRKAAANENVGTDDGTSSDVSSDAGFDSDDVDSDDFDEDMLIQSDNQPLTHELSQQVDFVHF